MAYRRFTDRDGHVWEVRDSSRSEWVFEPMPGNPRPRVEVPAPGYESDPFEMSVEEVQRLLDGSPPPRRTPRPSPFLD